MEIASFLALHAPFDAMERDRLGELAVRVKTEQFPAGTVVLQQSGEPSRFLYVVRHGSVEILDDGNLVDRSASATTTGRSPVIGRRWSKRPSSTSRRAGSRSDSMPATCTW